MGEGGQVIALLNKQWHPLRSLKNPHVKMIFFKILDEKARASEDTERHLCQRHVPEL